MAIGNLMNRRRSRAITFLASAAAVTYLAFNQGTGAAATANAGSDVSVTIPTCATVDGTGSTGASSYALSITSGPTTSSTCSDSGITGYNGGDLWQCTDGSSAEVVDNADGTFEVCLSAGDDDGAGAGDYVATLSINGGASTDTVTISATCTTPLYAYFQLCSEYAIHELDTTFGNSVGTDGAVDFPTLPQGALTPTTAGTIGAFNTAAASPSAKISLTADIESTTPCNLATAQDLEIDLAGYHLDYCEFSSTTDAAVRVHIYDSVGGGTMGAIQHTAGTADAGTQHQAVDVTLEGFVLGLDFASAGLLAAIPSGSFVVNSATFLTTGNTRFNRLAFTNMIVKGRDDDPDAGGAFAAMLLSAQNVVIANTAIAGGVGGTFYGPGRDDWSQRLVGVDASVWNVDTWMHSGLEKAAMRSNAESLATVYFTTAGYRGTARESFYAHLNNRNLEQNNTVITIHYWTDWLLDGFNVNLDPGTQSTDFGVNAGQDYYYAAHLDIRTPSVITAVTLGNTESAADLAADTDVGDTNTYVAFSALPTWPTITSSFGHTVGSDPYAIP